jgi:hypothetical protein
LPPRFFLSYARANNSPLVRKFFDDLCLTIRGALGLPRSDPVGFYEEVGPQENWSAGASEALQSCHAMVCLLSLAYFHSELAGKEWQIFETRRRQYGQRPAPVILPVSWITTNGAVPEVVRDLCSRPDTIYQQQPIVAMFKSASLAEYNEFVKTLACKIIDATPQVDPLPLQPFPSLPDVQSAFYLWDGPAIVPSQSRGPSLNPQTQPAPPPNPTLQNKYSTYAISKSSDFLDMVEDSCRFAPFKVSRYEDPEHVVTRVRQLIAQEREKEVPELFVLDLDGGGKEEIKAVKELYEELDVPSGILAVSGKFDRRIWDELKGATPLFGLFDSKELINQMQLCADIGRSIRNYRDEKRLGLDPSRNRQVFLSYRSSDSGLATVLRRSLEARRIGVSYMDEIEAAGRWKDKIETWISQAQIFLALVTDSYLTSKYCEGELRRFTHLLAKAESATNSHKGPSHLILNLYNLPDTHKNDLVEECKKDYQHFSMSDANFAIGLSRLVIRIQDLLRKPAA